MSEKSIEERMNNPTDKYGPYFTHKLPGTANDDTEQNMHKVFKEAKELKIEKNEK